ncbi:MAG: class I SAM-dependent methyltransferase [Deltaproteobacteria bacterium]|nr:class I SAM-dependent methyltransferase [Deltaproteobacteria bacterium]
MKAPNSIPFGNIYDKYNAGSPLERFMVKRYLGALKEMCTGFKPESIVELGAGEGYLAARMVEFLPDRTGLFLATDLKPGRAMPGIQWAAMDATRLALKDQSFDLVLACEVLEHLEKPSLALKEAFRISRGHLLISVPFEPIWRIGNVLRGRYVFDLGNTPGHVQHFTPGRILGILKTFFEPQDIRLVIPWILILASKR